MRKGIVIGSWFVDVREGPSYETHMLGVLKKDEEVSIISKEGRFYKIVFKKTEGYIEDKYISIKEGD